MIVALAGAVHKNDSALFTAFTLYVLVMPPHTSVACPTIGDGVVGKVEYFKTDRQVCCPCPQALMARTHNDPVV